MYCQKCGNQVSDALKYCNNCGANQKKGKEKSVVGKMLDDILTTLFLVVMFGLGILVGLVAVMLANGLPRELVAAITIAYLIAVFSICFMLMTQVKRIVGANLEGNSDRDEMPQPSLQLPRRTTAQLETNFEPASVTENTTRTLDEVLVERKAGN
jgi:hypothetical protein